METLLDYGSRAAWKASARGEWFIVKADVREGYQQREFDAQRHAGVAGVPVPEIIAFAAGPIPVGAMRWTEGVPLHAYKGVAAWRDAGRVLRMAHGAAILRRRAVPWGELVQSWLADEIPYLVDRRGLATNDADAALRTAENLRPLLDQQALVWLHGDCQASHFLVDPAAHRVTAVVDWADAQEGDATLDIAILSLFDRQALPDVLDGYEASAEFRQHLAATLPLYRALRGAGAARWLDEHGYAAVNWPIDAVREFARLGPGASG